MIQKAIHELVENKNLDFETTKEVMDEIMSGNATQAQISSFLTALRMKGETIDEITACATVMRDKAVKLSPPFPVMDIVGTGGDEVGTFNISTTSAFVAAAGGIRVAKHAAPVRKEIGIRSIFNILGPLSNPAGASMQLLGVYSRDLVEPLAQVLANLGVTRGMVVCGGDGLDEATLTGPTHVCEIRYGKITAYDMTPEELGLTVCNLEELIGGTPEENAQITRNILSGSLKGPKRDVVVLNAAISLYLGIDDCTVRDCVKTAQDMIDSGAAMAKMEEFIQATKKAAGEVKAS